MELLGERTIALVQHVLELSLGITVETNKFETIPVTPFPSDNS